MMNSDSTSTGFRMILFGGPDFLLEGRPVPLSPLQRGLLGLLYGHGGGAVGREEILDLLWPADEPRKARRRLNQLLYSIKKKTGGPIPFESQGDDVIPGVEIGTSDLDSYEGMVREGRFRECADLLSKGFLKKSSGQISRSLTQWIEEKERGFRTVLDRRLREALSELESKASWREAQDAAEALASLNPLDEGVLRCLMRARARGSGVSEAEAAFVNFANRREAMLGRAWVPQEETLSLLEKIRLETESPFSNHTARQTETFSEPRLVGRDTEHALLRRTLETPPRKALRGILVTGEAGIGKTRLIRESVFGLGLEGQSVFSADQAELEQLIPLNPLIEALRRPAVGDILSGLDEPWRAVLYGVMPSHFRGDGPIPQAPQIQPGSVPRRLFEAFHQLLLRLVEEGPVTLVVEDLQWADETTLSVLEFLFKRWDQGRLQALFSLRSEEIKRTSALQTFLETLRVHDDFLELPLTELNGSHSVALIRDLSPRPLNTGEIRHLHALAGGNPFFIIELTLEYLAGRVDQPTFPQEVLSIPLSIRQVLERRMTQLSQSGEKSLGALSVHSRGLAIEALARVAGLGIAECISGLDQLHEFRLIRSSGAEVSVGHELIRQTVYQSLTPSRRAWLHHRLARHLQASSVNPPPDELAIHYHFAGAAREALTFSREAAEKAEASGAIPEALRFLGIAREHTDAPDDVAEIIGRMGHLNYLHQNLEEAAPLLEAAAQRFRRQGREADALKAELERVDSLGQTGLLPSRECLEELERIKREAEEHGYWETFMRALDVEAHKKELSEDLDGVREILARAAEFSEEGGPKAHCQAQALIALNIYFGSPEAGLDAARQAVSIARTTIDDDLLLHAMNRLIIALHYQGLLNLREGQVTLREAETLLGNCGDLILKSNIRLNSAVWLLETGELERAAKGFSAVETVITGTKAVKPLVMLKLNEGEMFLDSHEIREARVRFRAASDHHSPSSPRYFKTIANAGLGLCALHEGDLQEARILENLLVPDPGFWTFDPTLITIFRARMMIRRGNTLGAADHLRMVRGNVEGRFLTAWLRLLIEELKIRKRSNLCWDRKEFKKALQICEEFGLSRRQDDLVSLNGG